MRNLDEQNLPVSHTMMNLLMVALILFMTPGWSGAAEVVIPKDAGQAHLQTNGPAGELDNGDWWANASGGGQPHILLIYVPFMVSADFDIQLDLYDPECLKTGGELDEQKGAQWDETTFRLMAPDGSTIIAEQTFPPLAVTSEQWVPFAMFTAGQYGWGIYQLLVSTAEDDENTFRLRIRESDPDGIPESGDEMNIAVLRGSLQFTEDGCIDLHYYVPQMSDLCIANFDLDAEGSVTHHQPSGDAIAGTVSGDAIWNNSESSALPPPGGDEIAFPQNGWWNTRICATANNQFTFNTGLPYLLNDPPAAADLAVFISDGLDQVTKGQYIEYTVTVDNQGSGPAQAIVLNVVLSNGLTVVNMGAGGVFTAPNLVTWNLNLLKPGDTAVYTLGVHVSETATAPVVTTAQASYQDLLFNNYLSPQAIDSDQLLVSGGISGVVWHDPNENGLIDSGEQGMANIRLFLVNAGSETLATVLSQADGAYAFSDIPVGLYRIAVDMGTLPPDWGPTTNVEEQWFVVSDQGENYADVHLGFNDLLIPVELSSFTAAAELEAIVLYWTTQSETENVGFNVYRSDQVGGSYRRLNRSIIHGAGSSQSTHHYAFTDRDIADAVTYYYKISDISYAGVETMHGPISITSLQQPAEYKLEQNYPNPFNAETVIPIQLRETGEVRVIIYNLLGQEIRRLVDESMPAGRHLLRWDGKDHTGQSVPAGIYFCHLAVNEFNQMRKMQYVR